MAEFLGIDVQQIPWRIAFVTHNGLGRFQIAESGHAGAS